MASTVIMVYDNLGRVIRVAASQAEAKRICRQYKHLGAHYYKPAKLRAQRSSIWERPLQA